MSTEQVRLRRALLGVSDKSGLAEFARVLVRHGVELLSTGGTKAALDAAAVPVKSVEEFTGFPEMLDGRVKTERKGVGTVELIVTGRAAHAGVNPEDLSLIHI